MSMLLAFIALVAGLCGLGFVAFVALSFVIDRECRRFTVRYVFLISSITAVSVFSLFAAPRQLGWRGFEQPPKVGEQATDVIARLGMPHFDSREDGDPPTAFRLGYTDRLGTRHHLTVENGVVVKIEYSSR
jgi:hypothetical protein